MDDATKQILDAIDQETNAVAAEVDSLKASLAATIGAQSAPDPALLARLQAVSDRLKGIAADPAQPIPPTPLPPA